MWPLLYIVSFSKATKVLSKRVCSVLQNLSVVKNAWIIGELIYSEYL
jgi:hypothetical protein